jgi:hypothetical protein
VRKRERTHAEVIKNFKKSNYCYSTVHILVNWPINSTFFFYSNKTLSKCENCEERKCKSFKSHKFIILHFHMAGSEHGISHLWHIYCMRIVVLSHHSHGSCITFTKCKYILQEVESRSLDETRFYILEKK